MPLPLSIPFGPGVTPFLSLGGIRIPVAADSMQVSRVRLGETWRAHSGRLHNGIRMERKDYRARTPFLAVAEGLALANYLDGKGHVWNFDSWYSDDGLPYTSITNATIASSRLSLGATTGAIVLPASVGSTWTVYLGRIESGSEVDYVVRSDGAKWVDGVRNDAASTTWLSVATSVTLSNTTGAAVAYEFVAAYPFLWSEEMGETVPTVLTPRGTAEGDFDTASVLVESEVTGVEYKKAASGLLVAVDFALHEVPS